MSKGRKIFWVLSLSLIGLLMSGGVLLRAAEEVETELEAKAAEIDRAAAKAPDEAGRTASLAKQFDVSESRISSLRNQKVGWGEMTIRLAMAKQLTERRPLTTEQALGEIEPLRQQKIGWGKIAQDLGLKLGPVLSEVKRGERSLQTVEGEKSEPATERKGREERLEKFERNQHRPEPAKGKY